MAKAEDFYTLNEVCKKLGICRVTAVRAIGRKEIKGLKVGKQWRFSKEVIDEMVAKSTAVGIK